MLRTCLDCFADIGELHGNTKRCRRCRANRERLTTRRRVRRWRAMRRAGYPVELPSGFMAYGPDDIAFDQRIQGSGL